MCTKDNKYIKQYDKEDYLAKNDFIFDLKKTHKLKIDKTTGQLLPDESQELFIT